MARTIARLGAGIITCVLLLPSMASAQQASASGIAGVVRDTSGAVLPGVTVEAASPALIEKVRSVVTDSEGGTTSSICGRASITVTFTLSGFNAFRRDGIELTSGFTATVNADMQVGALTETITVTGESPLVDTRNVRRQTVVSSRPAQRASEQREEPEQPRRADAGIPRQRRIRRHRRLQRSDRRHATTARAAPTSSSTAWASSTPPATRATTPTPTPCRNW